MVGEEAAPAVKKVQIKTYFNMLSLITTLGKNSVILAARHRKFR